MKSREFTGYGFFTSFTLADDAPILKHPSSCHLGDVIGDIEGVEYGVGFVLFVENGKIKTLEGYTYGVEKWPETLANLEYRLFRHRN